MAASKRKRPLYLVLALLGAVTLGATGAFYGWSMVTLYREPIDPSAVGVGVVDQADRVAIVSRFQGFLQALDAAKARGWPLAVADLLLGGAILIVAMRTMGGSGTARRVLVQLVIAQVGASVLSYWLLRDVFEAHLRFAEAGQSARFHESIPDRSRADEMARTSAHLLRAATPVDFALRTLGSLLIVFALTRRRSRELLDSSHEALGEP